MTRRRFQSGEGQAGCIVGLLILLAIAFLAYKMVPVKVKAAEFRQELVDEAKSGSLRTDKQIQTNLLNKAEELGLPLTEQDLKIQRSRSSITIEAHFVVPIEFPGYTYMWEFNPDYSTPLFNTHPKIFENFDRWCVTRPTEDRARAPLDHLSAQDGTESRDGRPDVDRAHQFLEQAIPEPGL